MHVWYVSDALLFTILVLHRRMMGNVV